MEGSRFGFEEEGKTVTGGGKKSTVDRRAAVVGEKVFGASCLLRLGSALALCVYPGTCDGSRNNQGMAGGEKE